MAPQARRGPTFTTGPSPASRRIATGRFLETDFSMSARGAASLDAAPSEPGPICRRGPRLSSAPLTRCAARPPPGHHGTVAPSPRPTVPAPAEHPPRAPQSSILPWRAASPTSSSNNAALRGIVFEPGQEIERLAEIAAVIELAGQLPADISCCAAMCCDLSSNIRRRSSWVRSHQACDFLIGIRAAQRRLGAAEAGLHGRPAALFPRARHSAHGSRRLPAARRSARAGSAARSRWISRRSTMPASTTARHP